MMNQQIVRNAVKDIQDPELKKSLLELGMIRDISVAGGQVRLTLALTTAKCPKKDAMIAEIRRALEALPGVSAVEIKLTTLTTEELKKLFPKHPLVGVERVRHVLAVASGKGGVGKTTLAVNLALALSRMGKQVGLLDADVYGPNVPLMLGLEKGAAWENQMMIPAEKFGLKVMSLGMLTEKNQSIVWKGPLVSKAIGQLLGQVLWGELDFLVVDLPPGTGDPSITIARSLPDAGVLIVTTPQEVALADVRRAIDLFEKFNIKIVGLVENMSYFFCGHTAKPIEIFGSGGGEKLRDEYGLPLLAKIPIDLEIGQSGDSGSPLMISVPDSETGRIFQDLARAIMEDDPHQ